MVHRWYEGASTVAPHGTPVVRMLIFFTIFIFYCNLKDHVIKFDIIAWNQSLLVEIYKIQ